MLDDAIVCDESITAGWDTLDAATGHSPAHDLLSLTGLAIGQGLLLAAGAAIAHRGRGPSYLGCHYPRW